MRTLIKITFCLFLIPISILVSTTKIIACDYEATIEGNTLSFKIMTDLDYLAVVQYLPINNPTLNIIKLSSPDIGSEWNYYSDSSNPNCGEFNGNGALACNQTNSNGAYWSNETPLGVYHPLPGGIYKIEFDSSPNFENIGIEYGLVPGSPGENWTFCTRTGDITYPTITPTPTPSLTPSPTLTPTPTPTPSPTPIPVEKIVFAPGITASWNIDALINCKNDPTGNWILAPYAENVYSPLLQTFKNTGWDLLEFYYDWRKNPKDTANKLKSFIDDKTKLNEKVNFIGHSMGGLVGKSYLDNTEGKKINSFLSVGTPYKGSALAYPPWEGAETWSNNLFEKIAITLYLKHCGGLFSNGLAMIRSEIPALQSLLPTEPYLINKKDSILRLPSDDSNRNNWFSEAFSDFSGVRSGNIAGTGVETLKVIQTKTPNKKDQNNGLWVDGSPAGKITSIKGDGTVLVESALMNSADEKILVNQSHRGLVSSVEGIKAIINFFGIPDGYAELNLDTEVEQPNSALILIGYPATFSVIDENGNIKGDKQGMVAIMNPKTGNYKLNILARSNDTTFIIAQFLPNGDLKYKEYKLKGIGPKFKNINFSVENPQEDILR